jgi:hypothetical protein
VDWAKDGVARAAAAVPISKRAGVRMKTPCWFGAEP